jgi:hypothetical protein
MQQTKVMLPLRLSGQALSVAGIPGIDASVKNFNRACRQ